MMEEKHNIRKIRFFERKIMDFYRKAGREHLPWRRKDISAYEVWVSEIMLQQTQVSRVIGYYEKFLKRFPTVRSLALANWEEFLPYYAGLGYYRRGRNMLLTAQRVADEFDGEFPRDKKLLITFPGVGEYTASAILSFAYDDNHLAWDTNLTRVIGRYFFGSKQSNFYKDFFEKQFTSSKKELNAALMDFGSAICLGRPKCNACPLVQECIYFSEDGAREVGAKEDARRGIATLSLGLKSKQKVQVASSNLHEQKIDWRSARVYLWLHKDHKLYYSSDRNNFAVFIVPSSYNTRAGIKAYFKDMYALDVSVRPPHAKVVIDGKATLFVNAQILLGEPLCKTFSKDEVKRYNETIHYF